METGRKNLEGERRGRVIKSKANVMKYNAM
jgi:hypothetical protein